MIVSVGVDEVAKIEDEAYILSIIKIYGYFFVFSVVPRKVELLKISKELTLRIYRWEEIVDTIEIKL